MKRNKKAFTLIELLVVVLIIGILAAVAVPQYQKAVEKSRLSEAVLMVSSLERAIDLYILEHGALSHMEWVDFLGTDGQDVLNLDFKSALNCTENDTCNSKYFVYGARCVDRGGGDGTRCFVSAARKQNGDLDNETEYVLDTQANSPGGWNNNCYYYTSAYPYGETLCKSLETHGWNAELDE